MRKKDLDLTKAETMSSAEIGRFLKDKEKLFCREYLTDQNGTQAAIRAGYKPGKNNASAAVQAARMLRDPAVSAYRKALIRETLSDKDLTRENIGLKYAEILDRCMQKEAVMEFDRASGEWIETGEWQFDARGAARALEGLVRLMGYAAPEKHEVQVSQSFESAIDEEDLNDG